MQDDVELRGREGGRRGGNPGDGDHYAALHCTALRCAALRSDAGSRLHLPRTRPETRHCLPPERWAQVQRKAGGWQGEAEKEHSSCRTLKKEQGRAAAAWPHTEGTEGTGGAARQWLFLSVSSVMRVK